MLLQNGNRFTLIRRLKRALNRVHIDGKPYQDRTVELSFFFRGVYSYFDCVPEGVVVEFRLWIEDVEPEEEDVDRQEADGKEDSERLHESK